MLILSFFLAIEVLLAVADSSSFLETKKNELKRIEPGQTKQWFPLQVIVVKKEIIHRRKPVAKKSRSAVISRHKLNNANISVDDHVHKQIRDKNYSRNQHSVRNSKRNVNLPQVLQNANISVENYLHSYTTKSKVPRKQKNTKKNFLATLSDTLKNTNLSIENHVHTQAMNLNINNKEHHKKRNLLDAINNANISVENSVHSYTLKKFHGSGKSKLQKKSQGMIVLPKTLHDANISVDSQTIKSFIDQKEKFFQRGLLDVLKNANISVQNSVHSYTVRKSNETEGGSNAHSYDQTFVHRIQVHPAIYTPLRMVDVIASKRDEEPESEFQLKGNNAMDVAAEIENNDHSLIPMLAKKEETIEDEENANDDDDDDETEPHKEPEYVASDKDNFPAEYDPFYAHKNDKHERTSSHSDKHDREEQLSSGDRHSDGEGRSFEDERRHDGDLDERAEHNVNGDQRNHGNEGSKDNEHEHGRPPLHGAPDLSMHGFPSNSYLNDEGDHHSHEEHHENLDEDEGNHHHRESMLDEHGYDTPPVHGAPDLVRYGFPKNSYLIDGGNHAIDDHSHNLDHSYMGHHMYEDHRGPIHEERIAHMGYGLQPHDEHESHHSDREHESRDGNREHESRDGDQKHESRHGDQEHESHHSAQEGYHHFSPRFDSDHEYQDSHHHGRHTGYPDSEEEHRGHSGVDSFSLGLGHRYPGINEYAPLYLGDIRERDGDDPVYGAVHGDHCVEKRNGICEHDHDDQHYDKHEGEHLTNEERMIEFQRNPFDPHDIDIHHHHDDDEHHHEAIASPIPQSVLQIGVDPSLHVHYVTQDEHHDMHYDNGLFSHHEGHHVESHPNSRYQHIPGEAYEGEYVASAFRVNPHEMHEVEHHELDHPAHDHIHDTTDHGNFEWDHHDTEHEHEHEEREHGEHEHEHEEREHGEHRHEHGNIGREHMGWAHEGLEHHDDNGRHNHLHYEHDHTYPATPHQAPYVPLFTPPQRELPMFQVDHVHHSDSYHDYHTPGNRRTTTANNINTLNTGQAFEFGNRNYANYLNEHLDEYLKQAKYDEKNMGLQPHDVGIETELARKRKLENDAQVVLNETEILKQLHDNTSDITIMNNPNDTPSSAIAEVTNNLPNNSNGDEINTDNITARVANNTTINRVISGVENVTPKIDSVKTATSGVRKSTIRNKTVHDDIMKGVLRRSITEQLR